MANTPLPLRLSINRKVRISTHDYEVQARSRALCLTAAGKVDVNEKMWLNGTKFVTDPSNRSQVFGIGHISNQALESAIALQRPFSNTLGKVTYRPKEVEPRKPRCP